MNCLAYALRYWKKDPRYRIYYDGNHVINSKYELHNPRYHFAGHYMDIALEGYDYFAEVWAKKDNLLDEEEQDLLRQYFNISPHSNQLP